MTPTTTHIRFQKRICPVQYEHEEMEVQFAVEANENLAEKTQLMKQFVYNTLYGIKSGQQTTKGDSNDDRNSNISSSTESKENGSKKASGEKSSSKESSKEAGSEKSSKKASGEKSSSKEEVNSSEKEEMEEVSSPYSKPAKEAGKKPVGIPYDCELKEHKSTLTNFLTKLTGGKEWAQDKEKSKKVSREILHGQPFLDKSGKILSSFEDLCKEHYGNGESGDVL